MPEGIESDDLTNNAAKEIKFCDSFTHVWATRGYLGYFRQWYRGPTRPVETAHGIGIPSQFWFVAFSPLDPVERQWKLVRGQNRSTAKTRCWFSFAAFPG
ncbi:hypothetical protein N7539_004473 [Penicillium diatomitis]|uniref:Uncharacterized protein n=1 Tax=Penicillium diatomitis TaxID=2819901 RepID=A0A9X0BYN9_9EURO|nr:uncharacterized protein N7539_004473 [Penicillium diatomitis]KAJ5489583.1 hypothetical protein N7539_004473 [Penicillium diatomitis]